jgi:hypothetical protein
MNPDRITGKKLHFSHLLRINGTKNSSESGMLTRIELAN